MRARTVQLVPGKIRSLQLMASAFSAILVYAPELLPGRVGLAAGMFYRVCLFLLLLGLLTAGPARLDEVTSVARPPRGV